VRVFLGEKKAAAGVIPGHEMAGEVVEVGPGAQAEVGDVVSVCPILCCGRCSFCRDGFRNRCPSRRTLGYDLDGGIAEYVRIPAQMVALGHLLPMDPASPPHIRALLEPVACVLNSIEALQARPGDPFAVVGGGPMGLLHVLAARASGAGEVLVVEPDDARREVARELGATAVTPGEAPDAARDMTRGEGFTAVAMAVGFVEALPSALAITRKLGSINLFAGFPPGSFYELDVNRLHYDEIRLLGTQNAPFHLYARAARLIPSMPALEHIVTHRYRLEDAAAAYAARLGREGLKSAVVMGE
jgi:L-iditol 2-dehydrogenase